MTSAIPVQRTSYTSFEASTSVNYSQSWFWSCFVFELISKIFQNCIQTRTWFNWFSLNWKLFSVKFTFPKANPQCFKLTHETDGSVQLWHIYLEIHRNSCHLNLDLHKLFLWSNAKQNLFFVFMNALFHRFLLKNLHLSRHKKCAFHRSNIQNMSSVELSARLLDLLA